MTKYVFQYTFHLLLFADTFFFKLGAPETITLLTAKSAFFHFSWYFFFKNLTYIYVGTYINIYFNIKLLGILTNLFFKIGLVCRNISL